MAAIARALAHVVPGLTPAMVEVLAACSVADAPATADVLGLEIRSLAGIYAHGGGSA